MKRAVVPLLILLVALVWMVLRRRRRQAAGRWAAHWDGARPRLRSRFGTAAMHEWWPETGAAADVRLHSGMGLLPAPGGGGLAVDRLVWRGNACLRIAGTTAVLRVRLPAPPRVGAGPVRLLQLYDATGRMVVGLGYGSDGRLRHVGGGAVEPVGRPLPVGTSITIVVRYEANGAAVVAVAGRPAERCGGGWKSGRWWAGISVWGNPDGDDANPDPERRLIVESLWLAGVVQPLAT